MPAEILAFLAGMVLFGFGMFLWGTLVRGQLHDTQVDRAYADGFRDGWEAAEQLDNDVRVMWGVR